jgi:hypothetical protein
MSERIIAVGFDAPGKPIDCFTICCELQLGEADPCQPSVDPCITRRKAQSFFDMGLRLCPPTQEVLGGTNLRVRVSQIAIQHQRSLALGYPLRHTVRINQHVASVQVGQGIVWREA